ncbi:hypothetical protein [Xenorhabdus cabanillasii]|uniref:Uncharacterized protein n=1 Tax=Xenorhabdus cabanillasii JM26 TaxID=1427517 RepID=W1IMI1_9GAMM|nr:hypothetical protein [Xenorhabdus cabanillasii]PHM76143.1 hypothetical protein Xcab_03347 [Xenorhabdus cabanillasii JM26]CDL79712.1 hypothetical protein XCR1_1210020 [Xenorhabdus cabanillasii JM26]
MAYYSIEKRLCADGIDTTTLGIISDIDVEIRRKKSQLSGLYINSMVDFVLLLLTFLFLPLI